MRSLRTLVAVLVLMHLSSIAWAKTLTKKIDLDNFDRLSVSSAFKVEVSQSDTFSVVVRIDDSIAEHLNVRKSGKTLKIGLKHGNESCDCEMSASIKMPTLRAVEMSGASKGTISRFSSAKEIELDLSGASSLVGDIKADGASVDLSGAAYLELKGSATGLKLELSGASTAELNGFSVPTANVEMSGASRADIRVTKDLAMDLSGASRLIYTGNPQLGSQETSGAASVRRK